MAKVFSRNRIALIPAHDAEYTIAKVILLCKNYVDRIFVFNDGSEDLTPIMSDLAGAMMIGSEGNNGKGYAMRELFNWAKEHNPEWVVTLDADDQHDPQDIPRLAKLVESGEFDVVVGRRNGQSIHRRIVSEVISWTSGTNIDLQSGFRVYNRKALNMIEFKDNGFGADQEIMENLMKKELKIGQVDVGISYNRYSHTKNPIIHFMEIMKSIFFRRSLVTFGLAGGFLIVVGFNLIIRVLIVWEMYQQLAVGTLILGEFSIMAGMLTFFSGLILHLVQKMVWK